jgi:hypothetical protein
VGGRRYGVGRSVERGVGSPVILHAGRGEGGEGVESANFAPPTIPTATPQQIFGKQQSERSFHSVSGDRVLRYVAPSPDRGGS